MVTQTEHIKSLLKEYHQNLVANTNRKQFEGMLKEIVTPTLTGLYGNTTQGLAVRSIQTYVEDLIPKIKTPKMRKLVDNAGLPMLDKYGKQQEQYEIGPDGKVVMVDVPMFEISQGAYNQLRDNVNKTFEVQRVYWRARSFVEGHLANIDEEMFDKMNDYLWRNIMAVKYPEDVKREFKHLCINIKRKLYFLGDRDEVHNQTLFGLYGAGGTGKTTLLGAFAKSFSDHNEYKMSGMESFFKFNGDTKDKFGVLFLDEEARGSAVDIKNKLKQFVDSDTRKVEMKGVDPFTVNNLLTMVVSANHKIAPSLFEDEARGQRRDACFECIGLLQQYQEKDLTQWFDKMFDVCPFADDYRTYRHHNPHHDELIDREAASLKKILRNLSSPSPMGLHELAETVGISVANPDEWYGLRTVVKMPNLFTAKMGRGTTLYTPNLTAIRDYLGYTGDASNWWWNFAFMKSRPWIDVDAVIDQLKNDATYDTTKPITYKEYIGGDAK